MTARRKRICILGSTGSIGENALRVVSDYPDDFEVVGLSANASAERLYEQAVACKVQSVCLNQENGATPAGVERLRVFNGPRGMIDLIDACEPDLLVVATVGYAGLAPTLHAIAQGVTIALANKEVLVAAGELVMTAARRHGVAILPIDSEHNAIFQCLAGRAERSGTADDLHCPQTPLRRIILTASGGPFRGRNRAELGSVTVEEALAHPTWQMGRKITIDSATLMNKGFEVIETHHLFSEPAEKIEVVIHPQSVIHGMIEYQDGSMLAQLGVTDMYLPIVNVLAWPRRLANTRFAPLDLPALGSLTFDAPDLEAFPCLQYAYEALRLGGTAGAVLNAANEVAVARFLAGEIPFLDIPGLIEAAMSAHSLTPHPDLPTIEDADRWGRDWCEQRIRTTRSAPV